MGAQLFAESLLGRILDLFAEHELKTLAELNAILIRQKILTQWQLTELLRGRDDLHVGQLKLFEVIDSQPRVCRLLAEDLPTQRLVACSLHRLSNQQVKQIITSPVHAWWRDTRDSRLIILRQLVSLPTKSSSRSLLQVLTDYEDGPTLRAMLEQRGPLPWAQAAGLAIQLVSLLRERQPTFLCEPLNLTEFHVTAEGRLRWNLESRLLASASSIDPESTCRWSQQVGLLLLSLTSGDSPTEWMQRFQRRRVVSLKEFPEWNALPKDARTLIEQLIVARTFSLGQARSSLENWKAGINNVMGAVPEHRRRSHLNQFLRRSPRLSTPPSQQRDLAMLLATSAPAPEKPTARTQPVTLRSRHDRREVVKQDVSPEETSEAATTLTADAPNTKSAAGHMETRLRQSGRMRWLKLLILLTAGLLGSWLGKWWPELRAVTTPTTPTATPGEE
ncbi:MAG: hypothetical protein KDA58_01155 [Planctomycetaceae bacterium]|nr:hypothetical protein [Planctomycetaceae bacterium]